MKIYFFSSFSLYLITTCFAVKSICTVNIDCDQPCIAKYGTNTSNIQNLLRQAIYPYINDLQKDTLNFNIGSIRFHHNSNFGNEHYDLILKKYSIWVSKNYPNNKFDCASILLTNVNAKFNGIAYVDTKCSIYNTGVVRIDIHNVVHTIGHEIGHIIGLKHTCTLKGSDISKRCEVQNGNLCNPINNGYLMHPSVNRCSKNINKLSPCSINNLHDNVQNIQCLKSKNTSLMSLKPDKRCHLDDRRLKYYIISTCFIIISGIIIVIYLIMTLKQ
jgi:hypothetical protein